MLRGVVGSGTGALTPTQMAAFNNSTALLLPKWRAKVGAIKAAMGNSLLPVVRGTVLCIGDSITAGAYSNSSVSGDWRLSSWPSQLAAILKASGINAFSDSFMGFTVVANDSRAVLSAPWTALSTATDSTIGGSYAISTNSDTGTGFSYTPSNPVDTFKFRSPATPGAGVLNYNLNGGANSTLNLNIANALATATITTSLGTNTINFSRASGGFVFISGVQAWNSQISALDIINAGWNGGTSSQWNVATKPWNPANFSALGADLTIIMLGINDLLPVNGPIPATTTKTNIQTFITSALTTGDVLLVCENPAVVASTVSLATQATYWQAVKDLATTNNLALVSIFDRWVSYEYSNPLGYYDTGAYPANLHPVGIGYSDIAQAIFNVIGNP